MISQNDTLVNASSGLAGTNSAGSLLAVGGVVILLVLGIVGSQTVYRAVLAGSSRFAQSLEYAIKGVATALFLGIISAPLYLLSQLDGQSRVMAGKIIGGLLVAYGGLVVLGFIGEKAWGVLNRRHERATGHTLSERLATDSEGENA
jgi:hypothetical protein